MGTPPRPTAISNLALTYRCNSRCSTCGIWSMGEPQGRELTAEELHDFFRENRGLLSGVKTIQLTGGEPFLREDIAEVAEAIWSQIPGAFVWVATNGSLPDTIVRRVGEMLNATPSGGLGVTVSLDGLDETHDAQRGVPGSYLLALETLRGLFQLKRGHPRLGLSAGMTITPLNQGEIVPAMRVAEGLGADFTVRPANFSEAYYRNRPVKGEWDLTRLAESLRAVAAHHVRRRGLIRVTPVIRFLQGTLEYASSGGRPIQCSAGSSSFFLDPYGDVYPCLFVGRALGNIRDTPFADIWASEAAEAARLKLVAGICPGCWVECETMREIVRDKLGLLRTGLAAALSGREMGIGVSRSSLSRGSRTGS